MRQLVPNRLALMVIKATLLQMVYWVILTGFMHSQLNGYDIGQTSRKNCVRCFPLISKYTG